MDRFYERRLALFVFPAMLLIFLFQTVDITYALEQTSDTQSSNTGSAIPTSDTTQAEPEDAAQAPVEVAGDKIEYLPNEQKIIGTGNVIVTHKDMTLTADHVEVLTDKKQVFAEGHVVLYRREDSFRADKVFYDFAKSEGTFPDGYTVDDPWYGHGDRIELVGPKQIEIYNGYITTCDLDRKHYDFTSKHMTIYLEDKVILRNVLFRVLGKPIFWWPYYTLSLENRQAPVQVSVGHSKQFGSYILTSKGFSVNEHVSGKWHADWREKRGVGWGVDFDYEFEEPWGRGEIKVYGTADNDTPDGRATSGNARDDKNLFDDNRGRFSWKHRSRLDEYTDVLIQWHELSDEFIIDDFFDREFYEDNTAETFIDITRNTPNYGLVIEIDKRSNRFESKLERLPEIRFNWKTDEIGDSGIYYQNEEVFSVLNSTTGRSAADTDVVRFNTFQKVNYPKKFFRLDFNPFVNWEGTYWSKNRDDESATSPNGSGNDHITRQVWGGGLDISTRFYRVFDVQGSFLGIQADKIRHLVEPSVRYATTREVTRDNVSIFQLDAVDSRTTAHTIVFGLENRLQTKRMNEGHAERVDIVSAGTFATYNMSDTRANGTSWTSLTNNVQLRPYNWLTFEWNGTFDMDRDVHTFLGDWPTSNIDMVIHRENLYFVFGHRYSEASSSEITMSLDFWLNARWGVGVYWRHEFDRNRTQETEILLRRDLHDWLLDFGYSMGRFRGNPDDDKDWDFFVELTLKGFPEFPYKTGDRVVVARPRIGNTVSGADSGFDLGAFRRGGFGTIGEDPLLIEA